MRSTHGGYRILNLTGNEILQRRWERTKF